MSKSNLNGSQKHETQHHGKEARPRALTEAESFAASSAALPVPMPAEKAPAVPEGFVPGDTSVLRAVLLGEVKLLPQLSVELQTVDASDFGPGAPNFADLSALMALCYAWSVERIHTDAWRGYVRSREAAAWSPAMEAMKSLRPWFELRVQRDSKFAEKYPVLAMFFGVRSSQGKRAGRTRKAKKAAGNGSSGSPPKPST